MNSPFLTNEEALEKLREMAGTTVPYSAEFNALCKAIAVLQMRIEDQKAAACA